MNLQHLSEEQLDDILLGDAGSETLAHSRECAECGERVSTMQSAIQSFNSVSMSWSERRSATMPPQPVTDGSPWGRKLNWGLTAVAVAVAAIVLPIATRHSAESGNTIAKNEAHAATAQTAEVTQVAQQSPAVISISTTTGAATEDAMAHDNRMLRAIDDELDASAESPAQTFGIDTSQGGGSQNHGLPIPISD